MSPIKNAPEGVFGADYICGGCCIGGCCAGGCAPPDFFPFIRYHAAPMTTTAITIYHNIGVL